ncbi:Ran-binding protein [Entamoeba marina]
MDISKIENIIVQMLTTTDNNERLSLQQHIPTKVENVDQVQLLLNLLFNSNNPYIITYSTGLLGTAMESSPELFINHIGIIQNTAITLYSKLSNMKGLASTLFSRSVIASLQFDHNYVDLIQTLEALEKKSFFVFLDISLNLLDTLRSYLVKPTCPKKLLSDFRNGVLMRIAELARDHFEQPGTEVFKLLENVLYLSNVTKPDETEEMFTFFPAEQFFKFFQNNLNCFLTRTPDSLQLLSCIVRIRQSCFTQSDDYETSRSRFIQNHLTVISYCIRDIVPDMVDSVTELLYNLHSTHPIYSFVDQEYIDMLDMFSTRIALSGSSKSFFTILRFWGSYSLYSPIIPTTPYSLFGFFSRLICEDDSDITNEYYEFFGKFSRTSFLPLMEYILGLFDYIVSPTQHPNTKYHFHKTFWELLEKCPYNKVLQFRLLSRVVDLSASVIEGRDCTATDNTKIYSEFCEKIAGKCKIITRELNGLNFSRSEKDTPMAQLQNSIVNFYKAYVASSLWDENRYQQVSTFLYSYSKTITEEGIQFFLEIIAMVFDLIQKWSTNADILLGVMKFFSKIITIKEYSYKLVTNQPLKDIFENNCYLPLSSINVNPRDMKKIRLLYFSALGSLAYNIPFQYHINLLQQLQQPHPYQLLDARALVKASQSSVDKVPPIFEHICAKNSIYFHIPTEPVYSEEWHLTLKFIKEVVLTRDFRYSYAVECPTGCHLFHFIAEVIINFAKLSVQQLSVMQKIDKAIEEAFVGNYIMALGIAVRMMENNHVNFAAFNLYQDTTVNVFVNGVCEMAILFENLSIGYSKKKTTFSSLAESISKHVISLKLDFKKVEFLLNCALTALKGTTVNDIIQGGAIIEQILYEAFKHCKKDTYSQQLIDAISVMIPSILMCVFDNLLNEYEAWTLEKLVFACIIIYPNEFKKTQFLIANQFKDMERKQKIISFFSVLEIPNASTLDEKLLIPFDEKLKEFISAIKPIYHYYHYPLA